MSASLQFLSAKTVAGANFTVGAAGATSNKCAAGTTKAKDGTVGCSQEGARTVTQLGIASLERGRLARRATTRGCNAYSNPSNPACRQSYTAASAAAVNAMKGASDDASAKTVASAAATKGCTVASPGKTVNESRFCTVTVPAGTTGTANATGESCAKSYQAVRDCSVASPGKTSGAVAESARQTKACSVASPGCMTDAAKQTAQCSRDTFNATRQSAEASVRATHDCSVRSPQATVDAVKATGDSLTDAAKATGRCVKASPGAVTDAAKSTGRGTRSAVVYTGDRLTDTGVAVRESAAGTFDSTVRSTALTGGAELGIQCSGTRTCAMIRTPEGQATYEGIKKLIDGNVAFETALQNALGAIQTGGEATIVAADWATITGILDQIRGMQGERINDHEDAKTVGIINIIQRLTTAQAYERNAARQVLIQRIKTYLGM